jgi:methyl-accepting chemotaxis protein
MSKKGFLSKFKETVASKLVLVFVISIVLMTILFMISTVVYKSLINDLYVAMSDGGISTYEVYISSVEQHFETMGEALASSTVYQDALETGDTEAIKNACSNLVDNVDSMTFVDSQGKVVYSSTTAVGTDLSSALHIQDALQGNICDTYIQDFEGAQIGYVIGYPVKKNDRVVGAVSFLINLSDNGFLDSLKQQTGYQYTIFNDDTRVSTTLYDEHNQRLVGTKASNAVLKTVKEGKSTYSHVVKLSGVEYTAKYIPLSDDKGKYIGIAFSGMNVDIIQRRMIMMRFVGLAAAILIGIISILVSIKASKKYIIKPLFKLSGFVRDLSKCDIQNATAHFKIDTSSKDEVSTMAAELVSMSESLSNFCAEIVKTLEKIADGDLTVQYNKSVFIGDLKNVDVAFEEILSSLNTAMSKINISAGEVASGAEEVSSGAQALSQGATEQASEIEQLSNLVKEITSKISQNARHATEASELTNNTSAISIESKESMQNLSNAMLQINEVTAKMEKIVKTIDNFAFQTNILALNAAVEAARAGVHGRGFAVVAEEVRSLASKSADAAKETGDLIESTVQIVESGVMLTQETSESFEKVVGLVDEITERVVHIADASNEQAMSASHIVTSIDEITKVIQTNSATAEESAAASEQLSSLSNVFKDVVHQFKIHQSAKDAQYAPQPKEEPEETYAAEEYYDDSADDDKYF